MAELTRRRNKSGLTLKQRAFLTELAASTRKAGSWREAARAIGITPKTVLRWLKNDPAFAHAYDNLFDSTSNTIKKYLDHLTLRAAEVYDEALDASAEKKELTTCPSCGHRFEVSIVVPEWQARLRAADTVMKSTRLLTDVKQIETKNIRMTWEEALALAAYRAGKPIPPALEERLRTAGLLAEAAPSRDTIEGEAYEIDSPD